MAPLNANVAIIQYLDLVLSFPPDSINESSNISSLFTVKKSYLILDTEPFRFVPFFAKLPKLLGELRLGLSSGRKRSHFAPLCPPILVRHEHRCRHSDRRVRSNQNSNHKREREPMQYLAAKQI